MLKTFIKLEFKRAFCRWQTMIAFLIFIGAFIHISYQDYHDIPKQVGYLQELVFENHNFFIAYLKALGFGVNSYLCLIIPLIALLIAGDSLAIDRLSGFLQFTLSRIDYKNYIKYKSIAVSIVSFSIMFLFQIAAFIYSAFTHPFYFPKQMRIDLLSAELYIAHPFVYVFLIMLFMSLMAMAVSLFGLAVSNKLKNIYSVVTLPWIFIVLISMICMGVGPSITIALYNYSPLIMSGPYIFMNELHLLAIPLYWIILLILSYLWTNRWFKKEFEIKKVEEVYN